MIHKISNEKEIFRMVSSILVSYIKCSMHHFCFDSVSWMFVPRTQQPLQPDIEYWIDKLTVEMQSIEGILDHFQSPENDATRQVMFDSLEKKMRDIKRTKRCLEMETRVLINPRMRQEVDGLVKAFDQQLIDHETNWNVLKYEYMPHSDDVEIRMPMKDYNHLSGYYAVRRNLESSVEESHASKIRRSNGILERFHQGIFLRR